MGTGVTIYAPSRRGKSPFADGSPQSVVLIDGEQLTRLMIEYGVAVSTVRTVRIVRVDGDFFEDG